MGQRSILLVTYHFHPSTEIGARRVTALARYLAGQGFRVVVVSQFAGHEYASGAEILPGVIAVPVAQPRRLLIDPLVALKQLSTAGTADDAASPKPPPTRAGLAVPAPNWRLRDLFFGMVCFIDPYKRWSLHASRAAVRAGREFGARVILSSGPPHSPHVAASRAAGRLGIPHITDLRDPWADDPGAATSGTTAEENLLRRVEGWVMKRAAAITSTSAAVAKLLARNHAGVAAKIHVVRNGFDGELVEAPTATGGRLAILFAGELYLGRDPFPLLSALEALVADPQVDASRITLTFMGRCSTYGGQSLGEWLRGKRCEPIVKVLGHMPASAVTQAAREATVLLNLAQQQPLSVPAKTFEHLASGREILLVCENDGETAQLVAGIRGVKQVDQADAATLESALRDLYQRHVVQGQLTAPDVAQVRAFSRAAANAQLLSIMRSVAKLD